MSQSFWKGNNQVDKTPTTLEEWEEAGYARFFHIDIPYPTQDKHTPEDEAAYSRGFLRAQREQALLKMSQDEEPDGRIDLGMADYK